MTVVSDDLRARVRQALDSLDANKPLSHVLGTALRVARLRYDLEAVVWLQREMANPEDKAELYALEKEILAKTNSKEVASLWSKCSPGWMDRHRCTSIDPETGQPVEGWVGLSAAEMEYRIDSLRAELSGQAELSPEARRQAVQLFEQFRAVLSRIRTAVYRYLSNVEAFLAYEDVSADIFDANRREVESELSLLSPKAAEQLTAAVARVKDEDPESLSHAASSCRRLLKSLADKLYPANNEEVVCADGKSRKMIDDDYLNRLTQFVSESLGAKAKATKLVKARLGELDGRTRRLNDLASKGVHAEISPFEARQCVIQTYLLVADLLHLRKVAYMSADLEA